MTRLITLFTDFGSHDIYVGQLHAMADKYASDCRLVDLFHDVSAFDFRAGASLLAAMANYLPDDAIVVAVVDPGVGGQRIPIAIELEGRWLVGPDNGLFSRCVAWTDSEPRYWAIKMPKHATKTFHGRDVFLPTAIQLARGEYEAIQQVANTDELVTPRDAAGFKDDDRRVIHVDHYGNAITGIREQTIKLSHAIEVAGHNVCYAGYYELVAAGECFWYINSIGLVEISANKASAAQTLDIRAGDEIIVQKVG